MGGRGLRVGVACILVLGSALVAIAARGPDFVGAFRISDVNTAGDPVILTLTTRVFNYTASDVTNATVTLFSSPIPNQTYTQFVGVSIKKHHSIRLSARFNVPQFEYHFWLKGLPPNIVIQFTDASGNKVQQTLELLPGPIVGGQ